MIWSSSVLLTAALLSCDFSGLLPTSDALVSSVRRLEPSPVYGLISSAFGVRINPILKTPEFHLGIDVGAPLGTPICITLAGVVEESAHKGTYGLYVRIRHSVEFETAFAHLSALANGVRPGVMLQPGDVLGVTGNSGLSTGPHVHIETRLRGAPVDPLCALPGISLLFSPKGPKQTTQSKSQAPLRGRAAREPRKRK